MTYEPKAGDRVRVVLEDEIGHASQDGYFELSDGQGWYADEESVVSIEKIEPPLPTTPGSVIQSGLDSGKTLFWVLEDDGLWYGKSYLTDKPFAQDPPHVMDQWNRTVKVIFDAGKDA